MGEKGSIRQNIRKTMTFYLEPRIEKTKLSELFNESYKLGGAYDGKETTMGIKIWLFWQL